MVTGLYRERDGEMCLADTGRAEEEDILLSGDKGEIEQLHDRAPIQVRVKGEIVFLYGTRSAAAGPAAEFPDASALRPIGRECRDGVG